MSKKVLFYMILDSIGIALTVFIGKWLCKMSDAVTNPWVSNGILLYVKTPGLSGGSIKLKAIRLGNKNSF